MKKVFMLAVLTTLLSVSCTNGTSPVINDSESTIQLSEDQVAFLNDFSNFVDYTSDVAIQYFDINNKELDVNGFVSSIDFSKFKYIKPRANSEFLKTRNELQDNETGQNIGDDWYKNVDYSQYLESFKDIFTKDAYQAFTNFIMQEELTEESLENLKDEFLNYSTTDQQNLLFFCSVSEIIRNKILSYGITTKFDTCSFLVSMSFSYTGSIWAAAVATGPWGIVAGVAISAGSYFAAEYLCN